MKTYPPLNGKIITLTRPQRHDYVRLGQIFHVSENMAQVDVYNNPTPEELEQIWQMHNTAINEQKAIRFTINHNLNAEIIGCCGFSAINLEERTANYGIILDHNYWHTGIDKECTILSYDLGFNKLGLENIEVSTKKGRATKYLKKFGFVLKENKELVQIGNNTYYNISTYSINKKQWCNTRKLLAAYISN